MLPKKISVKRYQMKTHILEHLRNGWLVVPSHRPLLKWVNVGNEEEKNNLDMSKCVKLWRGKYNTHNPLLITGKVSGVCVIDVDTHPELNQFAEINLPILLEKFPFLKKCPMHKTVSDGYHIFIPFIETKSLSPDDKNLYKYDWGEFLNNTKFSTLVHSRYPHKITKKIGAITSVRTFEDFPLDKITVPPEFIIYLEENKKKQKKILRTEKDPKDYGKYDFIMKYLPEEDAENPYPEWKNFLMKCKNAKISWEAFKMWCSKSDKFDENKDFRQWDNFERQPKYFEQCIMFLVNYIFETDESMDLKSFKEECIEVFLPKDLYYAKGEIEVALLCKEYWKENIISIGESQKTYFVFSPHKSNLWIEHNGKEFTSSLLHHLYGFYGSRRKSMDILSQILVQFDDPEGKNKDMTKKLCNLVKNMSNTRYYKGLVTFLVKYSSILPNEYNDTFDTNLDVLACKNGLIDLKTGKLGPIKKEEKITVASPTRYFEDIDTKYIEELMYFVFGELTDFVQMWLGYMITGRNNLQKYLIHYGEGSNFKSTLDKLMSNTLGKQLYQTIPLKAINQNGTNNNYLYTAKTARCLSINETKKNEMYDAGCMKNISSGDPISVMAKYTAEINYIPKFKVQISTNHKPVLPDDDPAMNRRTWLMEYLKIFLNLDDEIDKLQYSEEKNKLGLICKKDPNLSNTLKQKTSEFLRWLVKGAMKYYENGMLIKAPLKIQEYTLNYIKKSQILKIFMEEHYVQVADNICARVPLKFGYAKYLEYSGKSKYEYSQIKFRKDISKLGFVVHNARRKTKNSLGEEKTWGRQLCILGINEIYIEEEEEVTFLDDL